MSLIDFILSRFRGDSFEQEDSGGRPPRFPHDKLDFPIVIENDKKRSLWLECVVGLAVNLVAAYIFTDLNVWVGILWKAVTAWINSS